MRPNVLIMAPPEDLLAAAVRWALTQIGADVTTISDLSSPERLPHRSTLLTDTGSGLMNVSERLPRYTAVWRRRIDKRLRSSSCETPDSKFVALESETFDKNFVDLICSTRTSLCVNDRFASQRAENKQLQLLFAQEAGLGVPDTLVSQNPLLIRQFVGAYPSVIVKPLTGQIWGNKASGKVFSTTTNVLPRARLEEPFFDESCALCPSMYQAHVDKVSDIRAVVMGSHIEAVEIVSLEAQPSVDCRTAIHQGLVDARRIELDEPTASAIRKVCDRFGISYASVDLARTRDGQLVFLELNPAGQFLFVEDFCPSARLLSRFATFLAGGDPSKRTLPDFGFADFEASQAGNTWSNRWLGGRPPTHTDSLMVSYE